MTRSMQKAQKREEAIIRNKRWSDMTTEQKITYLNEKKLRATKQRHKLSQYDESGKLIIPEDCVN